MDNQQPPPPPPAGQPNGVGKPNLEAQEDGEKGDGNPQLEPQAAVGNVPQPLSEEDQESIVVGQKVRKRLRALKKLQSQINLLEKSQVDELSEDQRTKLGRKDKVDALCLEFEEVINQSKAEKPAAEPTTSQRKSVQKMKREVKLAMKDPEKQAKVVSYSDILSKTKEDKIAMKFEAFCLMFTVQGEYKSYCTGVAKSMIARLANTMVIKYAHLEAYDKDMAKEICRWPIKMMPRLTDSAKKFLCQIWSADIKYASKEDIVGVKEMLEQFKLQIADLPRSHKMLESYMAQWPKVETCVPDDLPFNRPTQSSDAMVSGILREVVVKHRRGLSWNGQLGIGDMEVKDDCKFIITKVPLHRFDTCSEVSLEIAGWLKNDFAAVWSSVCKRVQDAAIGSLPHYPAMQRKLTQTDIKVFRDPVKLYALQETVLHIPAAKPGLERSLLLSATHSCCRSYDMNDPEAPYKTLLFDNHISGELWSQQIYDSGNSVLTGVLEFGQEDEVEALPANGPTRVYIGPDGWNFQTLQQYMRYIQTHLHDPNGSTFGAYVDYSRHLSNHGTKYSRENRDFQPPTLDSDGVLVYRPRGNEQGPRHQPVQDLGIFESAAALFVEDALTDMINLLLEHGAITGMLIPFWVRYKNCGNRPPEHH